MVVRWLGSSCSAFTRLSGLFQLSVVIGIRLLRHQFEISAPKVSARVSATASVVLPLAEKYT